MNWEESDEKYVVAESDEESLSTVLYDMECRECGGSLTWIMDDPDPDHPGWTGECYECDAMYSIRISTVVALQVE